MHFVSDLFTCSISCSFFHFFAFFFFFLFICLIARAPAPDKVLIVRLKNSIPNDRYQIILSTEQDVDGLEELVLPTFEVSLR
jgi:hypothetical protein